MSSRASLPTSSNSKMSASTLLYLRASFFLRKAGGNLKKAKVKKVIGRRPFDQRLPFEPLTPSDFEPYEYYSENGYLEGFCEIANKAIAQDMAEGKTRS